MHFYSATSDRSTLKVSIDGTANPSAKDHVIPGINQWETWKQSYGGYADLNRCIISLELKVFNSLGNLIAEWKEFHVLGPEIEKLEYTFHSVISSQKLTVASKFSS